MKAASRQKKTISVSIIVPVYNMQHYLERCLESLVHQTLDSIEIIIVNDGSIDDSQRIIDVYAKNYPRKVVSYYTENGGLSRARNFGVSHARGTYIGFVDSDDYVDIHMFEELFKKGEAMNADIICSPITFEYHDHIVKEFFPDVSIFGENTVDSPAILESTRSYACSKIYRKNFWDAERISFPEGIWYEDTATIYPALVKAKKVEAVNYPFYHYDKTREGAITQTVSPKVFDIFQATSILMESAKQMRHIEKFMDVITSLCVKHIFMRIKLIMKSNDENLKNEFLETSLMFLTTNVPDWKNCSYMNKMHLSRRLYYTLPILRKSLNKLPTEVREKLFSFSKALAMLRRPLQNRHSYPKRPVPTKEVRDFLSEVTNVFLMHQVTIFYDITDGNWLESLNIHYGSDFQISIGLHADGSMHSVAHIMESHGMRMTQTKQIQHKSILERYTYMGIQFTIRYYREEYLEPHEASNRFKQIFDDCGMIDMQGITVPILRSKTCSLQHPTHLKEPDDDRNDCLKKMSRKEFLVRKVYYKHYVS